MINDPNKRWMASGAIGCTFAALFARNPAAVAWVTVVNPETVTIPPGAALISYQFPEMNKDSVTAWALQNGFYFEKTGEGLAGLRFNVGELVSWVQYFGPDSHVITRRAPVPELMLCVKLPAKYFFKVGFTGILHLAHASVEHLRERVAAKLWETSFIKTRKKLGHSPDISEAAKTTFNHYGKDFSNRSSAAGETTGGAV